MCRAVRGEAGCRIMCRSFLTCMRALARVLKACKAVGLALRHELVL